MSGVFVDTSAVLALLNPHDEVHPHASRSFDRLRTQEAALITSSFVLVETYALLGRRLGLDAVRAFREDFASLLDVVWVDRDLHERGLDLLLKRNVRDLSLADAVSFLVIRDRRLDHVFAFDKHFEAEGFEMLSS